MKPTTLLPAALLAVSLTACGTSPDPAADPAPAATSAAPTSAAPSPTADSGDAKTVAAARAAVSQMKGLGATWPQFIKGYEVEDGVLWIETSLYPDSDADAPAASICNSMKATLDPFPGVSVRASTGEQLAQALAVSDPCA